MSKRTVLDATKTVVVIGNGMVGQRFVELCADELAAGDDDVEIVSLCEERLAAYNRVKLTSWFETRDANKLSMVGEYEGTDGEGEFYASRKGEGKVRVRVGALATSIDTVAKEVIVGDERVPYDAAVLATGSYPFVPPINGSKLDGVFVYRTIDDLEALVAYQLKHDVKKAAVIGGGLLGLEAAKALHDLGMKTSILEYAPILMARQIDAGGHAALTSMVEELGLDVMCSARTKEFLGDENGNVRGISFDTEGWETLDCGIIVVSAGIRPRDEVARKSEGVTVHERGGVLVDDQLRTTAENVFAIGEVALHRGMIYGLVAPGYDMAKMAAQNVVDALRGVEPSQTFEGADLSTKLKLLGCDVASFGDASVTDATSALVWDDTVNRIYRKLVFSKEPGARKLLGGILVGDAGDYSDLLKLYKDGDDCSATASSLLAPPSAAKPGAVSGEVDEATLLKKQICSCNDVAVGAIVDAIAADPAISLAALKKLTTAGTGCGGCEPDVKKILAAELTKLGMVVDNRLCEHFSHSRPELVALVKTGDQRSFPEVIAAHGSGHDGCEVCKPAVASILASLYNEAVLGDDRASLQDTNDRSLANMQRGGSYSVVPRIPAGEITPAALMAIAEVAADYKLYTKVTGAQRIDLFGAAKADLPSIWAKLGEAGLESGHAYGKSLRTVKSCVGSSWCRYGVQNSVDFAVTVETRYKGLRSPHKLKSGVSGCTRECAEAASKDFGMIATELGYDIYVCGNGGASPRLGVQLAVGVDEATTLKLLDRFLMYYILTAERLERTARWFERLGPNDETRTAALKAVVIDDSLGLNAEFEQRMDDIVLHKKVASSHTIIPNTSPPKSHFLSVKKINLERATNACVCRSNVPFWILAPTRARSGPWRVPQNHLSIRAGRQLLGRVGRRGERPRARRQVQAVRQHGRDAGR